MKNHRMPLSLLLLLSGCLSACSLVAPSLPETPTVPGALPESSILPTPLPTAEPGSEPTAEPRPTPTAQPTPAPRAQALPGATLDLSVIERTSFNGVIHDESGAALEGIAVTARSLNSSVPFEETLFTMSGDYSFNNVPAGVQIEITVSRSGYTTRRRVEVLKSNRQGDPNANRYDFGPGTFSGSLNNAMSHLPEVTSVSPGRNAGGVSPNTPIVLRFSKPMNTEWIEAHFRLSSMHTAYGAQDFQISWNTDATEFVLQGHTLEPATSYTISFANALMAQDGSTRFDAFFKLTEGPFESQSRFETR